MLKVHQLKKMSLKMHFSHSHLNFFHHKIWEMSAMKTGKDFIKI